MDPLVWYAAYGSNLNPERFRCYIEGGTPEGARSAFPGARDHDEPTGDRAILLPHRLYFARRSSTWGGGVAFIDPERSTTEYTLGRVYRIRWRQLEDVVAQELTRPRGSVSLTEDLLVEGSVDLGKGWYRYVFVVTHEGGEPHLIDGEPVITITSLQERPPERPTMAYLRHIATGLRGSHDLDDQRLLDYLMERPGIAGTYTREELAEGLEGA